MEDYLQTEFTDLKVWLTSTTEQWAVIAVQGPKAREVIAPLVEGIDISRAAMPHMSVREGKVCGVPTRLFRVSFTGELGFEINVPAGHGRAVWEAVFASGKAVGITPYGTETMHVLRAEKGYIIVGQETDGTVTPPTSASTGRSARKPDFVGKRSLARPDMLKADRKQLVGLLTVDPEIVLEEGAQIVADPAAPIPMTMLGHVTSTYWSATLGRSIALALVAGGRARKARGSSCRCRRERSRSRWSSRSSSTRRGSGSMGEVWSRRFPRHDAPRGARRRSCGGRDRLPSAYCPRPARGDFMAWRRALEWLLTERAPMLFGALIAALQGEPASVVDVSSRNIAIEVAGPKAAGR